MKFHYIINIFNYLKKIFYKVIFIFLSYFLFFKIRLWKTKSRLFILSDDSSWVLDQLKKEIFNKIKDIGLKVSSNAFYFTSNNQCIHFINKYSLLSEKLKEHKISLSYFHFDEDNILEEKKIINIINKNRNIKCIQVTNEEIKNKLLKFNLDKEKIFKIPIGIDINRFTLRTLEEKKILKEKKKINDFFVIGSFQKDGIGWGNGNQPKLSKGPDIFVEIIKKINFKYKKVHVILSGSSRGYMINELKKNDISFEYHYLYSYNNLDKLYSYLDAYIVSSRIEGGPRSILESMATGVQIYSSQVGQANEIIKNNFNGWIYDLNNIDNLVNLIIQNQKDENLIKKILINARNTAEKNDHKNHSEYWKIFFNTLKR